VPYRFVFSYARDDGDPHLHAFFDDLDRQVRQLLPMEQREQVGFKDLKDIKRGDSWPEALSAAVASSEVLVAMYSPAYFGKFYCGKEVGVFLKRGAKKPHIIPVLWLPFRQPVPKALNEFQYYTGDDDDEYVQEGLQYLRTLKAFEDKYRTFVRRLARRILDVAATPLPPLDPIPDIRDVDSAFNEGPDSSPSEGNGSRSAGPAAVNFVYITPAAPPWTWTPYPPPEENQIWKLAFDVARGRDFMPQPLRFDARLFDRLQDTSSLNEIVVFLVSTQSLSINTHQDLMRKYDRVSLANCAVLVIWPATANADERRRIERLVRETFPSKVYNSNEIYFRNGIDSLDALRQAIEQTLRGLQGIVINRASDASAPATPSLPQLTVKRPSAPAEPGHQSADGSHG